ncbi:transglycosylase SLT domain-containing protein, partial [Klebsiella pneumoniae]|uniref:transglycosylase SLT domain-containing protein n=2 Tax=Klebsiella pneumoniae TaxID=573 RepID=UPI002166540E
MKGAAFGIILSLIPLSSMAADCFDMAGRDYKIDPDLLRAISWQESRFKIDAIGRNPVTGYGSGLMQIDSQHFNELSRYGIKPDHLLSDACLNIYTGAYYLAQAFKKWGVSWDAVGAYNALMNPLMILVKIIKLRWIHILSYDQMVSRKIN